MEEEWPHMFKDFQHQIRSGIQCRRGECHHERDHSPLNHRIIKIITENLLTPLLEVLLHLLAIYGLQGVSVFLTKLVLQKTYNRLISRMTISPLHITLQRGFNHRKLRINAEERIRVFPVRINCVLSVPFIKEIVCGPTGKRRRLRLNIRQRDFHVVHNIRDCFERTSFGDILDDRSAEPSIIPQERVALGDGI